MKTGTLVVGMIGAGILGGVVGAWAFLTFFAGDVEPKPGPAAAPVEEPAPVLTPEEADALRTLPAEIRELKASVAALRGERGAGMAAPAGAKEAEPPEDEGPIVTPEERRVNETRAVATLRNSTSCQAQIQASGKIDADRDGIGEYGTLLEMTGQVGVRGALASGGTDFSTQASPVAPAIMSPTLASVDGNGVVTKNGYCFRVYLPDTGRPAGFVHERGPGPTPMLGGGTVTIDVDLSETTWCMYSWPANRGVTGTRVFFTNQSGDVMVSSNEVAKWSGPNHGPPGNSAFIGLGITSAVAVGTRGHDGDMWRVAN